MLDGFKNGSSRKQSRSIDPHIVVPARGKTGSFYQRCNGHYCDEKIRFLQYLALNIIGGKETRPTKISIKKAGYCNTLIPLF